PPPRHLPSFPTRRSSDLEIDPAADFLWGSVGFIATKAGVEDKQPRTDKEWETVRNNVIILIEATNLLVIPGRQVATSGSRLDPRSEEHTSELQSLAYLVC